MNDLITETMCMFNATAEQSVIGSMLIDSACVNDVLSKVLEDDFYIQQNKDFFNAIRALHFSGDVVDPVTVLDKMRELGTYQEQSQRYAIELMQVTPTAANVMVYADILKNETMKRRLCEIPAYIQEKLRVGMNPQDVCVYVQDRAKSIAESTASSDLISSLEACSDTYNYLDAIGEKKRPYVPSGFGDIDRVLGGGFMNEGLYILAARPGCGKTTLALQIAEKVAKAGIPTLFMSLEMSKYQITSKRISIDSGINYTKIITGNITQEEYAPIAESCSALSNRPLTINRKPSATVEDISFLAHQVNNLGFIVIDYLGLIRNNYGTKLYEKVTDTSNRLKGLARQLGVPVLCLAQLNREVEGRQSGRPKISDLRDSGAIEQDADGILLLYRDMDDVPDDYPADLTCIIGKNRHGRTGEINLKFFLPTGRIYAVMED